jgi:hypothetical protein
MKDELDAFTRFDHNRFARSACSRKEGNSLKNLRVLTFMAVNMAVMSGLFKAFPNPTSW